MYSMMEIHGKSILVWVISIRVSVIGSWQYYQDYSRNPLIKLLFLCTQGNVLMQTLFIFVVNIFSLVTTFQRCSWRKQWQSLWRRLCSSKKRKLRTNLTWQVMVIITNHFIHRVAIVTPVSWVAKKRSWHSSLPMTKLLSFFLFQSWSRF